MAMRFQTTSQLYQLAEDFSLFETFLLIVMEKRAMIRAQ